MFDVLPAQLFASQDNVRVLQDAVRNGDQSASSHRQEVVLLQVAVHSFHCVLNSLSEGVTRARAEPTG
jgi:hypothetical protein